MENHILLLFTYTIYSKFLWKFVYNIILSFLLCKNEQNKKFSNEDDGTRTRDLWRDRPIL